MQIQSKLLASLVGALSLVPLVHGCASSDRVDFESKRQAFESASDVMGFESVADWSSQGQLTSASEIHSGSGALAVSTHGYTEVISVPLSNLGTTGETISLQFAPSAAPAWGEVRLIVRAPSIGQYWRDLGGVPVAGLQPETFHSLEFSIPGDLRVALEGEYNDLTFTIVVNAPPGAYVLDTLSTGGAPQGTSVGVHLLVRSGLLRKVGDFHVCSSQPPPTNSSLIPRTSGHALLTGSPGRTPKR